MNNLGTLADVVSARIRVMDMATAKAIGRGKQGEHCGNQPSLCILGLYE